MTVDELWKRLAAYGVVVPLEVQRRIGLEFNQERVLIRPPGAVSSKVRVLEYGASVPAAYIARELGITVRQVRKIRQITRG